jgi:hypothetical protein
MEKLIRNASSKLIGNRNKPMPNANFTLKIKTITSTVGIVMAVRFIRSAPRFANRAYNWKSIGLVRYIAMAPSRIS